MRCPEGIQHRLVVLDDPLALFDARKYTLGYRTDTDRLFRRAIAISWELDKNCSLSLNFVAFVWKTRLEHPYFPTIWPRDTWAFILPCPRSPVIPGPIIVNDTSAGDGYEACENPEGNGRHLDW